MSFIIFELNDFFKQKKILNTKSYADLSSISIKIPLTFHLKFSMKTLTLQNCLTTVIRNAANGIKL